MKTAMDLKWISPEVRNQNTVDAFCTTAAGVANLIADLANHMPENELAPFRESAANMVQFLGFVLPLVTPEEVAKPQPQPRVMTEEEERMAMINQAIPTPPPAKATPKPAPKPASQSSSLPQTPSSVLDGILNGMGASGAAAAKALGVPAPKAQAPVASAPQILRESARVKAVTNKTVTAPNAQVPMPGDPGDLKETALVQNVLGEPAVSDYEAASVLCEIWRKA